ncbi:MAG: anti-sigma factor family protein [Bacillota bacterium]
MQCQKIQELLSAYIDGMLDPPLRIKVDFHLEHCRACREEYDALKMVVEAVRSLPGVEPPREFRQEMWRKIDGLGKTSPAGRGLLQRLAVGRWSGRVAAAATLVLVIGLAAVWQGWEGRFLPLGVSEQPESTVMYDQAPAAGDPEGAGESLKLKLPGGAADTQYSIAQAPRPETVVKGGNADTSRKSAGGETAGKVTPPQEGAGEKTPAESAARPVQPQASFSARDNGVTMMMTPAARPETGVIEIVVVNRDEAARKIAEIAGKYGGTAAVLPGSGGMEMEMKVPSGSYEAAAGEVVNAGKMVSGERKSLAVPSPKAAPNTLSAPGSAGTVTYEGGGVVPGEGSGDSMSVIRIRMKEQP